jgi:hypothetical protein
MDFIIKNWHVIVAGILGFYEVIVRLIPTASTWSVISFIVKILKWLSDNLDNLKK